MSGPVPPPGPHGGDGAAVARALGIDPASMLDLSASLNPWAPDVAALVSARASAIGMYPDERAATHALAAAIGADPDRIVLTNGGAEAIMVVASVLGGGVLAEPEFGLHPRSPHGPRWRSNPHNPSGRLAPPGTTAGVWDEAFYPLATGAWTRGDADAGAVVVGSLTKLFACPGLRVGYVLAPDGDIAGAVRRRRQPWSVGSLALAVLPDLLAAADLARWAAAVRSQREALAAVLGAHGLRPEPSDAPWLLAAGARGLRDRLAPLGVVVRDCAGFGLPDHVRIAVPDDAGLARLDDALAAAGEGRASAPGPPAGAAGAVPGSPGPSAAGRSSPGGAFSAAAAAVGALDEDARRAASDRNDHLTKPPGALGRLEALAQQLAAIAGKSPPPLPRPAAVAVFAADHGVVARGVTPWPQEVTAQMVANFLAGGAAINVLARQMGARVTVVDVGVAATLPRSPGLLDRKVRPGSADLGAGPALSLFEARAALDIGAAVAADLVAAGARALVTGDMGIGNTTASAALVSVLLDRPAAEVTGRGAGADDAVLAVKLEVVEQAAARASAMAGDPLAVLADVGGLEIAALAGFVVGGAAARVPVVVDGLVADTALLVASRLVPGVERFAVAGHRSTEPGASAVLAHLGLDPVLDLDLRLGEGSGACLALPVLEAAARLLAEMATFESASVATRAVGPTPTPTP